MVYELAADRPFQPPLREALEPLVPIAPFVLRIRRVGKSADVEQHLLDGDHVLAVAAELGDDLRDALARTQLAFADQNPRRRRHDRLGAREDRVERVVGRGLVDATLDRASDRAHRADFSVARDRDLRRWQQPLFDFALGAIEERFDLCRDRVRLPWSYRQKTLRCGIAGISPSRICETNITDRALSAPTNVTHQRQALCVWRRCRDWRRIQARGVAMDASAPGWKSTRRGPASVVRMTSHTGNSARFRRAATSRRCTNFAPRSFSARTSVVNSRAVPSLRSRRESCAR